MFWSDDLKCRFQGLAEQLHGSGLRVRQAEPESIVKKLAGQNPGVGLRVWMSESLFKVEMLTEQISDFD